MTDHSAPANAPGVRQTICSECGKPYVATRPDSITCQASCRVARARRRKKQGSGFTHWAVDPGTALEAVADAGRAALGDLPQVARDVLADELRPVVREHLSGKVLDTIGGLIDLMPLMHAALADDLQATSPLRNAQGELVLDRDGQPHMVPDYERRTKAVALMMKATVLHPGLSPQPEAARTAPITIEFTGYASPQTVDADVVEVLELPAGTRECDICRLPKAASEFVADSDRCQACHDAQRSRVEAALAARPQAK